MVPGPREFLVCLCERGAAHATLGVDVALGIEFPTALLVRADEVIE
jgi:hypothetical protein